MMKKALGIIALVLIISILAACKEKATTKEGHQFQTTYYLMDTIINMGGRSESEAQSNLIIDEVGRIFEMYHELANGYETLKPNSVYLENIYTINQKVGQKLEINQELYELILYSEELKVLTNGYFDISIGKIVTAWKDFVQSSDFENLEALFALTIATVDAIDTTDFSIELSIEEGKYFIKILGKDIKLDLGAIAKGYATQLAYDYLISQNLQYYFITAGSSSIVLGEKEGADEGYYRIGLAHPLQIGFPRPTYGRLFAKNTSITTSANFEQYQNFNELRYHHIVSPKTKRPMQYYHALTLVGQDAGFLDAVGTALFCMPENELNAWLQLHQETYQIEVIRFNYNQTITTNLIHTIFEEK
jgi:thiamine biosynthesis lipoprotein